MPWSSFSTAELESSGRPADPRYIRGRFTAQSFEKTKPAWTRAARPTRPTLCLNSVLLRPKSKQR